MMHRVNHPSLTNYVAGCILGKANLLAASLYIEFCDRGSLGGLLKAYISRSKKVGKKTNVPEGFI